VDQAHLYQRLDRSERTFRERHRALKNGDSKSPTGNGTGPQESSAEGVTGNGGASNSTPAKGGKGSCEGTRFRHCFGPLGFRPADRRIERVVGGSIIDSLTSACHRTPQDVQSVIQPAGKARSHLSTAPRVAPTRQRSLLNFSPPR